MKKFLILIAIIIFSTNFATAENFDSQLYLYCNHNGVDKCKYDMLLKQSLIINDLQLTVEQRNEMDKVFNIYSNAKAIIANDLKQQEAELKILKENKSNLKTKLEQNKKIKRLEQANNKLDKTIEQEVKKVLTRQQQYKYNLVKKCLF